MRSIKIYLTGIIILFAASSCKSWLSVDSEDRIMEDALYQTEDGFFTALNGIYSELPCTELYGKSLTTTVFDVQSQYYNTIMLNNHAFKTLAEYDSEARKKAVEVIWAKAYYMIANVNVILFHCEKDRNVLSDKAYHIIKGEALALRAMLHFEVFRIFGPIYAIAPGAKSIPYSDDIKMAVKPLLPANEVVDKISADLKNAIDLLKGYDPVITEGKLASEVHNQSNKYRYRNKRLNYFAAKALMARFSLYVGEKRDAYTYATEVIRDAAKFFPFATREQVSGQAVVGSATQNSEDRVFSSEILFAVHNPKRTTDIYDKFFSNKLETKDVLQIESDAVSNLYDTEGDLRLYQWQILKNGEGVDGRYLVKYGQVQDQGNDYASVVPVIRISEMYLIAAECETGAKDKAYAFINDIRVARKARSLTNFASFDRDLSLEYIREFVGEGQMFWFYKRRNESRMKCVYKKDEVYLPMESVNYLFPLPEKEQGHH